MKKTFVAALNLVGLAFSLVASGADSAANANYFPLAIGNTWNYKYWDISENGLPTLRTISDSIRLDGKLYYQIDYSDKYMNYSKFVRADSAGRIRIYDGGRDRVWLDFTLPDSSIYKFGSSEVLVLENHTANTIVGKFYNCRVFCFYIPDVYDAGARYYFAPMVGQVAIQYVDGARESLAGYHFPDDSIKVAAKERKPKNDLHEDIFLDNFPNPFNSSTTVSYQLASDSHVRLSIYNIHGQLVKTLVDAYRQQGLYSTTYDAQNMSSGIYLIQMTLPDQTIVKRIVHIR